MADVRLRSIREGEAEAFWALLNALDRETNFMMLEPGERERDPARMEGVVREAVRGEGAILVAEAGGEIVGFLSAERGRYRRNRHTAYVVTGIRAVYRGRGIGTALFAALDRWAAQNGVTRLELTVECPNEAAVRLYEKSGFLIEGTRRRAMRVDGNYVDEYAMAKIC